ncbi:MAG: hypothetical protein ACP6IP_02425 [Candidatus Njordarchaeia archaeon]
MEIEKIKILKSFWFVHILTGWISGWLLILILIPYAIGAVGYRIIGFTMSFIPMVINLALFHKNMKFAETIDFSSMRMGSIIMLVVYIAVFMGFPFGDVGFVVVVILFWLASIVGSFYIGAGYLNLGRKIGNNLLSIGGIVFIVLPPIGGLAIGAGLGKLINKLDEMWTKDYEKTIISAIINKALDGETVQSIDLLGKTEMEALMLKILLKDFFKKYKFAKVEKGKIKVKESAIRSIRLLENRTINL